MLEKVRPDWIFHLAAQSFVPTSWTAPTESLTTNVLGQVNLFEAVRRLELKCRIQLACSSEEYGMVYANEVPIRETNPLRPLSPYAVSKVAQDLLGYQYWMSWKVDSVRTRGFNHEGPRRGPVFVAIGLRQADRRHRARREAAGAARRQPRGQARFHRRARHGARATGWRSKRAKPGEVYNICRGQCWTIREVLDMLLGHDEERRSRCSQDPARLRPSDVPILLGDHTKFTQATGWQPTIPFEQTLRDMLEYWRAR